MRHLFAALFALSCSAFCANALAGAVQTHTFASATLKRPWQYTVYLPDGYGSNNARYPVVYLLHGNGGAASDWITLGNLQTTVDSLIARHQLAPVVIVMPEGATDWYVDRKEPIESAFFDDLIPHVESHYGVDARREARVIGGVSMGGFGALRYALTRPERFCAALLLSPAIYADVPPAASAARRVGVFGASRFDPEVWHALNYPALWRDYLHQRARVTMFIGAGSDDHPIVGDASLLYERLRQAGNPATLSLVSGGHTWDVWRTLLGPGLVSALACARQ
ncbi:MAG TPA: alpha/beta hydrolase-fold protein [Trinickia sp.]|nr:alpha/beta hydrolase-fold protein [Trinickia sp.]